MSRLKSPMTHSKSHSWYVEGGHTHPLASTCPHGLSRRSQRARDLLRLRYRTCPFC